MAHNIWMPKIFSGTPPTGMQPLDQKFINIATAGDISKNSGFQNFWSVVKEK
jgi:hypothetical protein